MKTLNKFLLAFLLIAGVAACKKDKNGGDGGNAAEGKVIAKVAGASFSSMTATATYVSTGKMLTILGSDASGKAINLMINGYDEKTGTYEITNGGIAIAVTASYMEGNPTNPSASKSWQAPYSGSGVIGKVQISEFSKTGSVKGTFNFTGKYSSDNSTKEITEGAFNLKVTSY